MLACLLAKFLILFSNIFATTTSTTDGRPHCDKNVFLENHFQANFRRTKHKTTTLCKPHHTDSMMSNFSEDLQISSFFLQSLTFHFTRTSARERPENTFPEILRIFFNQQNRNKLFKTQAR